MIFGTRDLNYDTGFCDRLNLSHTDLNNSHKRVGVVVVDSIN